MSFALRLRRMEQHPVPQQISSYQFRLVGDMTLKQFFEIAGGIVLALICYGLPLPGIFKWPLVIIFVLLGGALAFVPIEERPLEDWIIAFLRAIYQPTQFYWKKPAVKPMYFYQASVTSLASSQATEESVQQTENNPTFMNRLEDQEKTFFSKITGLLGTPTKPAPVQTPTQPQVATIANQTTSPIQPTPVVAVPLVTEQVQKAAQIAGTQTKEPEVKRPLVVPQIQNIKVEKQVPIQMQTEQIAQPTTSAPMTTTTPKQVFSNPQPMAQPIATAQFSPEAMPPTPPTQANVVVGQVTDARGKIVDGAILEIEDSSGRPVRALKTNKAGHFLIVTPLVNGAYDLIAEREGLEFETLKFEANGQIIPPILIKAKNEIA